MKAYVDGLERSNILVTFKIFEGCYHGFEMVAPNTNVSKDARNFMFEGFAKFYDKYVAIGN